ncbi:MAG: serine/threonine protein kinase [Nannocystis sp.]|nr:serine/threonine protein kinase [Nannocystis sp.]
MADAIALHPRGPDLRGRTLYGRFRLDGLIAPGGMADLYEALDLRLRRRVAIKALHPEHGRQPEQRRRFLQEAVIGARVDHPHVIPIFDHAEEPAAPGGEPVLFLVMPMLHGITLRQRILEGVIPIADALHLMIQLLDGLAAIHKLGAVHRDLKPENCLIVQRHGRDHLVLLDLGLAKVHTGPLLSLAPSSAPGALIGTLGYISPEQARQEPITHAVDIYAVGVILFELLARSVPFPGANTLEVLSAHAGKVAPAVREKAPTRGISDNLEALIASALEKDPARRPPDAESFRRLLAAELATSDTAAADGVGGCCLKGHDGVDEAKAALAAWHDVDDAQARALAVRASSKNPAWRPLAYLIECAAEQTPMPTP